MMGVDWAAIEMLCSGEFWRMSVLWTLALLSSYLRLLLLSTNPPPSFPRPRLRLRRRLSAAPETERPICVITGATSGLGAAVARDLAAEGYHLVLAGRSPELLLKTTQEIKERYEDACVKAFMVDLSSISSVIKFKSSLEQWLVASNLHPSVQLLINNAGILATSSRASADGYDQMMETNYISAFVLTNLLLPLLKNSPVHSRIVNVTSFTHRCVYDMKVDAETLFRRNLRSLSSAEKYPFACTYEYSKLCLLLFTRELHRQLYMMDPSSNVSVISADPGAVETSIMRELPPCISKLAFTCLRLLRLLQSPSCGASSIVDAALAPPDASGEYFFGGKGRTIRSSPLSYSAILAEKLWSSSFLLFQEAQQSLSETEET